MTRVLIFDNTVAETFGTTAAKRFAAIYEGHAYGDAIEMQKQTRSFEDAKLAGSIAKKLQAVSEEKPPAKPMDQFGRVVADAPAAAPILVVTGDRERVLVCEPTVVLTQPEHELLVRLMKAGIARFVRAGAMTEALDALDWVTAAKEAPDQG
mgnify:CR=1 FL=1